MESEKRHILCVCSGNIGRSPIMEVKLKQLFEIAGRSDVRVTSAGIAGTGGADRSRHTALSEYPEGAIMLPMLASAGLDISAHQHQPVTAELMAEAMVVLVPGEDVRSGRSNALIAQYPEHARKVKLLSEMVGREDDIPDFGDSQDPTLHERSLLMIVEFCEQGFKRIQEFIA